MAFRWTSPEEAQANRFNDPVYLQELLDKADKRTPMQKFLSKAMPQLERFNNFISKPRYAIGGLLTGKGAIEGIKQKTNPSEAFGIEKDTKLFSAQGGTGLAIDILFDPLTYIGVGPATKAAKIFTKAGTKTLSREGLMLPVQIAEKIPDSAVQNAVNRMVAKAPGQITPEVASSVIKGRIAQTSAEKYFRRIAEKGSPEAKKFFDQGGIKFMGKTIIGQEPIAKAWGLGSEVLRNVVSKLPGGKATIAVLDDATKTARGMFDANYGKNIFFEKTAMQAHRDLGDYSRKVTNNLGIKIFSGVRNADESRAIAHGIDYKVLRATYGDDLARFPDQKIAKEVLDSVELLKSNPRLQATLEAVSAHFDNLHQAELKANLIGAYRTDYVPLVYRNKKAQAQMKDWQSRLPSSVLQFAKQRDVPTIAEAKLLGLDPEDDIIKLFGIRTMASDKALANQKLIKTAVDEFGVNPTKLADSNNLAMYDNDLVPFSDPSVGEVLLPQEIVRSLQSVVGQNPVTDEATSALLRGYDKVNNFFKASYTSWIPAFHGRNMIGNVSNGMLSVGVDMINPSIGLPATQMTLAIAPRHAFGLQPSAQLREEVGNKVFTTRFGQKITAAQIMDDAEKMGIDKTFYTSGELGRDIVKDLTRESGSVAKKFWSRTEGLGREVGSTIETQARMQHFLAKRLAGHSAESAAELTKTFFFDYDNLSTFEKTVMRRAIPFYTWARKNMGLQAREFLSQPIKYGVMAQLSQKMNAGISQKDLDKLPDWMKNQVTLVTGQDGKKIVALAGFGFPMVDAVQKILPESFDLKGATKKMEDIVAMGAFVPKTVLELATGRDFFRGNAIRDNRYMSRAQFEAMPQFVRDYLLVNDIEGKDFVLIDPRRKKIIDSLPTSRAGNVFQGLTRKDQTATIKFIRLLTGITEYQVDPNKPNSQITKELQERLVDLGVVAEFNTLFIPKN